LTFEQKEEGRTHVDGEVSGLSPGHHGIHIHETGDLRRGTIERILVLNLVGCLSAGEHYNPFHKQHGGPEDTERHVGDLGNIVADQNGKATYHLVDDQVRLSGTI
jgi:Cu-Zn family superoxide dismutase